MTENDPNVKRYVRLKHNLLSYIVEQRLAPGERLPTENQLSEMFSVSGITVRRTLRELTEARLVERIQGKGTFLRRTITGNEPCLGTLLFAILDDLPTLPQFTEEFRKKCRERGYRLRSVWAQDSDMSGFIKAAREADGIFICGRRGEYANPIISSLKVPAVIIGNTYNPVHTTYVLHDHSAEIALLMETLAARGARRIALLNAPVDYPPALIFGKTFLEQCRKHGLPCGENDILWSRKGKRKEDIPEFFRRNPPHEYDAVVCEGGLYGFFTTYILLSGRAAKLPKLGVLSSVPETEQYCYEGVLRAVYKEELVEKSVDVMMRKMAGQNVPPAVLLRPELAAPESV